VRNLIGWFRLHVQARREQQEKLQARRRNLAEVHSRQAHYRSVTKMDADEQAKK